MDTHWYLTNATSADGGTSDQTENIAGAQIETEISNGVTCLSKMQNKPTL